MAFFKKFLGFKKKKRPGISEEPYDDVTTDARHSNQEDVYTFIPADHPANADGGYEALSERYSSDATYIGVNRQPSTPVFENLNPTRILPQMPHVSQQYEAAGGVSHIPEGMSKFVEGRSMSYTCDFLKPTLTRNRCQWNKNSIHWRNPLTKLTQLKETKPHELVQELKQIVLCTEEDFKIGEGQAGTIVYLGLMTDGQEVAVKEVLKTGAQWKHSMQDEVDILVKIRPHENIVTYKLTEWPKGRLGYIVTELCEFSLDKWFATADVKKMGARDWESLVPGLVRNLLEGLNHLHSQDPVILHRDIKPHNVLVAFHKGKPTLKLADFGISRMVDTGQTALHTNVAGTEEWRAAEVIRKGRGAFSYRKSTDIQVCGMVSYYIKSRGKHPFDANSPHEVEHKILNNQPDMPELNEPVIQDFLESMLLPEPKDRPSAAELLRHPYFWSEEKRYRFLSTLGNEAELARSRLPSQHTYNAVTAAIETAHEKVLPNGTDWRDLSKELLAVFDNTRPSDKQFISNFDKAGYVTSICKLLRTLRNLHEHFNQLSPGAKSMLGNTCFPYKFFDSRVPQLFLTVYKIIRNSATKDEDWTKREALMMYFSD